MSTTAVVVAGAIVIGVALRFALLAQQGGGIFGKKKVSSTAHPRGERQ